MQGRRARCRHGCLRLRVRLRCRRVRSLRPARTAPHPRPLPGRSTSLRSCVTRASDPARIRPMIKVGLLGCGTVGGGVVSLLRGNAAYLEARVGAPIEVTRVLVRDPAKERVAELDRERLTTDPEAVLGDVSL